MSAFVLFFFFVPVGCGSGTTGNNSNAPTWQYAAVHLAFNGAAGTQDPIAAGLLASDGFHPNDVGHKAIADQLRALAYAPLH